MKVLTNVEKFWKVYKTVNEMLQERNYSEIVAGNVCKTLEEFQEANGGKHVETIDKRTFNFISQDKNKKSCILVNFSSDESIGIKHITVIHERMMEGNIQHCILVYPNAVTSSAKKYVEKTPKIRVELFAENELYVNIMKHERMPNFRVFSDKEKSQFLQKTDLDENQLPRIMSTDPVARYLGLRRGAILEIIRKSETAGLYVLYRLCC